MARAMAKAGVSITITSFTDAMAFVLGADSQLQPYVTEAATVCAQAATVRAQAATICVTRHGLAAARTLDVLRLRRHRHRCRLPAAGAACYGSTCYGSTHHGATCYGATCYGSACYGSTYYGLL